MMMDKVAFQALGFGLLAAFFWGTHSVIVRFLTADLGGIAIAVLRLYIAAAALVIILRLLRHKFTIPWRDKYFLLTVFGATTNYIFFHLGLERTTASNAMMLENTAPFFVLMAGFVLASEKVRPVDVAATLVAIFGVFYTVKDDIALGGASFTGDLLELAAGATWAIFIVGSSRVLVNTNTTAERISFLAAVFLVSAVLLTPLLAYYPVEVGPITGLDVVLLVLLGILPTAVAYYLWYEAAARTTAIRSALLFTLSIVFTFINANIFLGEALTPDLLIGAILIVIGVLMPKLLGGKN
ncbi:MAG: DMT family transporter [Pseudomonadota bacterium]